MDKNGKTKKLNQIGANNNDLIHIWETFYVN